jgi:hypothetical protein
VQHGGSIAADVCGAAIVMAATILVAGSPLLEGAEGTREEKGEVMSENVDVEQIGPREYALAVHEGEDTTRHTLSLSTDFLDDLLIPDAAPDRIAMEAVRYLLDREPSVAIPAELNLDRLANHDHDFLPELRARLSC